MKKRTRKSSYIPRHAEATPGAEVTMRSTQDGDVVVSFADGSDDLHVSRRDFMRISGVAAASAALAGAACRNPVETIVPYVDRPEETRIGLSQVYATVWENVGVLVQTRAGRPVKLEGNPAHPTSLGALSARGQSSYMRLYDPDRARTPLKIEGQSTAKRTWAELDQEVVNQIKTSKTGGVRLLTRTMSGSAQRALVAEILEALPDAKHYTYEPLSDEPALIAHELGYGERVMPHYRFDKADVIVSLQSDFLGTWFSSVEFTKQFAKRRDPNGAMSQLIAFEGAMTLTGSNADVRYRVRPSHLPAVAMALAHELIVKQRKGALASNAAVAQALSAFDAERVAAVTGLPAEVFQKTAQALGDHMGKALVVAGHTASASAQGVSLEAAVNLLNVALESDGNTIERQTRSLQTRGQFGQLKQLVEEIEAGKVTLLIIADTNPVYSAPLELKLKEALSSGKVPMIVSCNDRVDETSALATYLATGSHYLESWGDAMPFEGVYSIQQPVIRPLYDTRPFEESLLTWFAGAGVLSAKHAELLKPSAKPTGNLSGDANFETGPWYRYVRQHWEQAVYPKAKAVSSFETFWEAVQRKGVWTSPEVDRQAPTFRLQPTLAALPKALPKVAERAAKDLSAKEVALLPTVGLFDGADANNGHLQEMPDPVTKHAWGSYVMISPKAFREAGLKNGDIMQVKRVGGERTIELPVIMQPGMHDDVVGIPLGYGRTAAGLVGNGVGENAFALSIMSAEGQATLHCLNGFDVELTRTRKNQPLCIAQGEHSLDMNRRTFMAATTLKEFKEDPTAGIHKHPELDELWGRHDYGDLRWGMAVDLTRCTGCSACVIACQEENNTPVVGRQGIIEGREMHWMRIDRYYRLPNNTELDARLGQVFGDPMLKKEPYVELGNYLEDPRVVFQPLMCQHCENAPCETVCPVLATMHSSDGLNQMAYNRCVGTRYCANNCPFKVRRFNWYNYSEGRGDSIFARIYPELKEHDTNNNRKPLDMGLNPEVTVRARGVMEKCSFCVQRIRRAKWQAKREGRLKMRDGDVVTACQQACPADAIVFGNLNDPDSAVAKMHALVKKANAVSPLSEIGVGSAVAYLTKIVNHDTLDALDNAPKHHGHGHAHKGGDSGHGEGKAAH